MNRHFFLHFLPIISFRLFQVSLSSQGMCSFPKQSCRALSAFIYQPRSRREEINLPFHKYQRTCAIFCLAKHGKDTNTRGSPYWGAHVESQLHYITSANMPLAKSHVRVHESALPTIGRSYNVTRSNQGRCILGVYHKRS